MKQLSISLILSLLLSVNANATESLKFINPWIPEAPPGASVMAGYMEIHNISAKEIDIIAINSPSFQSIEMHQSKEIDGFAKMLPQEKLSIPARGKLVLKSGSYHLMLIKPAKWLKQGDNISLNFVLSNNTQQTLTIPVKKTGSRTMKCAAGKCGGM